jgi:predicted component of type VI protein secretion system
MRVVSVHPARDPVACGDGPVRIGSASDDVIVPAGSGVEPHHVTLAADARGLLLTVRPGCQRVYVNARAVRERALLHYGDTLMLGANKFLVTTNSAPGAEAPVEAANAQTGQVGLRIVSGAASGQVLSVAPEARLGAGSRHFADLPYACRVVQDAGGVRLESESTASRVNGWPCQRARLGPGDQIVLGEHRLVVEAPALQYAQTAVPLPEPPVAPVSAPEPDDAPHTEIWWLIAAAMVLAAVIALFLYFHG